VDKINYQFDAIIAQNVLGHNPNPLEFLQACKRLMNDHTLLFVQTSQANMVINNEFDTIYHEHVNFFNINSMNQLASRSGLNLIDVTKAAIHGTSYIFVLSKSQSRPYKIKNLLINETNLRNLETYLNWSISVQKNISKLKLTIQDYSAHGYKIVGYGAAAKGNTLLNYINRTLELIIDDSPLKQNMYAPGNNSPVRSIDSLNNFNKDDKILFIPLAWNFFIEISQRIKLVRDEPHDLFLKYFPNLKIVSQKDINLYNTFPATKLLL
jgi:hypothetical protein